MKTNGEAAAGGWGEGLEGWGGGRNAVLSAVMFQPRAGFSRKTVANQISRGRFLRVHQSERGGFWPGVAAAV